MLRGGVWFRSLKRTVWCVLWTSEYMGWSPGVLRLWRTLQGGCGKTEGRKTYVNIKHLEIEYDGDKKMTEQMRYYVNEGEKDQLYKKEHQRASLINCTGTIQ